MALYARYREALAAVGTYLERTDLTAAQRNVGLEVLVTIHIAMRDQNSARQALEQLYSRDPGHQLTDPDPSPPVLSAFGRARSSPPPPITVELVHAPPVLTARRPPVLEATLGAGSDAISELRMRYRQGDDERFTTTVMNVNAENVASARLPILDRDESYTCQYYIEALAPSGTVLATSGSAEEPLTFTMPEAPATPAGGEGRVEVVQAEDLTWLWLVIAGAVLVAGAIVTGVLLEQELAGPDNGSLGDLTLPLVRF